LILDGDRLPQDYSPWRSDWLTRAIARGAAQVWRWNSDRAGQRPLLGRLASHVALALIFIFLLGLGNVSWLKVVRSVSEAANLSWRLGTVKGAADAELTVAQANSYVRLASQGRVQRLAAPHTQYTVAVEAPKKEITTYQVQAGDTVQSIAGRFGLQPTTIVWSNPEVEKAPDILRIGQELVILPVDGVYHTVAAGESLTAIAEKYKASVDAILNCPYNQLPEDSGLQVGTKLIVPGGTKPYTARTVTTYVGPAPTNAEGTGQFRWPTGGVLTQGYWYAHRAIDIGAPLGRAVVAADGGYISFAGWTDIGYGYLVVVDHANGYQTYYAHLSDIYVVEGQAVSAGEVIGAVGSTGYSTGPHLHFEIRYNGYPTNPLIYLP